MPFFTPLTTAYWFYSQHRDRPKQSETRPRTSTIATIDLSCSTQSVAILCSRRNHYLHPPFISFSPFLSLHLTWTHFVFLVPVFNSPFHPIQRSPRLGTCTRVCGWITKYKHARFKKEKVKIRSHRFIRYSPTVGVLFDTNQWARWVQFLECLPQQRYNLKPSLQCMRSSHREAELKGPANPLGLTGMMG